MDRIAALLRVGLVPALGALGSVGCAAVAPAPPAAVPVPVSPFADTAVSFYVRGFALVRGEVVIVRVCVGTDRSVVSSAIAQSSGDARFDQLAVVWARQIQLRTATQKGAPVASCGAVRVEMRRVPDTPVTGARDNLLG